MKRRIRIAILVMGFSGLVAEILLLREFLIVFSGNELCIGVILANWLILEALGCIFPGRLVEKTAHKLELFAEITALFSLSFIVAVFLIRLLKGMLGVSIGESIGFVPMFYSSFLILLPVSILHGALFTVSCRLYAMFSAPVASSAGRVYVYETIGTLVGGIFCTIFLIPFLHTFQAVSWIALLNAVVCLFLLTRREKIDWRKKATTILSSLLLIFSGYLVFGGGADHLHQRSIGAQWKNHNVLHYQNSRYGNICVVENENQYIFFQDGMPTIITPIPDIPAVEEFVHLPLLAHPEPAKILILSAGAGGVINEALKHPSIAMIDYVELDPLLLDLIRKFSTPLTELELNDPKVRIHHMDGRLLLKTTPDRYDLIFIGITEPSNLQANRFFTKEFFRLAQERLNNGGSLVLQLPGSLSLLNDELKNLNSCIYHTLADVFSHIRVIPGDGRNLFLSSDSPHVAEFTLERVIERLDERTITANTLVPWHIEKKLHPGWQEWFTHFIETSSRNINSDFKPLGLFYSLSHWNALYAPSFGRIYTQFEKLNYRTIFLALLFLMSACIVLKRRRKSARMGIPIAIVTTGFAGMIFSLIVIFTFQSVYGYVFSWIGLLVAFFMTGSACGAAWITSLLSRSQKHVGIFIMIELAIIGLAVILPLLLSHPLDAGGHAAFVFKILFLAVSFGCGVLVGAQFPLANKLYLRSDTQLSDTAGQLYACDLLGGWFGGIVGAVVLLPVLGLTGVCVTVALLKVTGVIVTAESLHAFGGKR